MLEGYYTNQNRYHLPYVSSWHESDSIVIKTDNKKLWYIPRVSIYAYSMLILKP